MIRNLKKELSYEYFPESLGNILEQLFSRTTMENYLCYFMYNDTGINSRSEIL